jgi:ferredoxin
MCRQGCCTICTFKVLDGEYKMDTPLGLLKDMRNKGYALSCCSYPRSDLVCELQSEDEMYIRQWSEGFEGGGVEWGGFLPEDD